MSVKKALKIGNEYVAEDDIVEIELKYVSNTSTYTNLSKHLKLDRLTGRIYEISNDFDEDTTIMLDMSTQFKSVIVTVPYSYIKTIKKLEEPQCQIL